jgi:hypothetical protein
LVVSLVVVLVGVKDADKNLCEEGILFGQFRVSGHKVGAEFEYLVGKLQNL